MEPLIALVAVISVIWLAGFFPATMAGWDKHYVRYSKRALKTVFRPIGQTLQNNKKFFWGMLGGIVLMLYLLSLQ
jgi:hypothetical protein